MRDGQLTVERIRQEEKSYDLFKLTGPVVLATVFDLQEALKVDPAQRVIIDFEGVPYIDSAGLGALLSFHAACRRGQRKYALAKMPARVYTIFSASKVDQLLQIAPSFEAAEALISK